jgi:hypothetical protein
MEEVQCLPQASFASWSTTVISEVDGVESPPFNLTSFFVYLREIRRKLGEWRELRICGGATCK